MNNQVKILLTINGIEGATLHRTPRIKMPFVITKSDIHFQNTGEKYKGKDGDKVVRRGIRKFYSYESVPCKKSIKLTQDAYNYMISTESPEWYYKKDWRRLKPEARLEIHLDRICKANNGDSFIYSILED